MELPKEIKDEIWEYSYLIECEKTGIYKIGHSKDPISRYKQIKTANPYAKLIGVSDIKEKILHEKYKVFRFSGEWFRFDDDAKKEVLKLFREITEDFKVSDDYILNKLIIESEYHYHNFNDNKVKEFLNKIDNKIFKKLMRNSETFWNLTNKSMTSNL